MPLCHFNTCLSDNQTMVFICKGEETTPVYLLGLNWADKADSDDCEDSGFCGFEFRLAVSRPFLRIGPFPSLRIIPGPSLPRVSDGAHTSKRGGPGWQLGGTWVPDDQEEVRGLRGGESSSVRNRTDFAGYRNAKCTQKFHETVLKTVTSVHI